MNSVPQERSKPSDEELLVAMAGGDDKSLDTLMLRHQEALFHFILRCTANTTLSSDIVQETFVRAWFKADRFRTNTGASAKTWLYAIALNLIRDHVRKWKLAAWFGYRGADSQADANRIPDNETSPDLSADRMDRFDQLSAAISRLPEKLRLPLVMCRLEGMSQNEAAALLGISRKSVEQRVRRAKDLLRSKLA